MVSLALAGAINTIVSWAGSTVSTSLTTLSTVFTQIVTWLIEFLGMISSEPLLLVGLAIAVAGMVIGLAFRAIRGKGRGRP